MFETQNTRAVDEQNAMSTFKISSSFNHLNICQQLVKIRAFYDFIRVHRQSSDGGGCGFCRTRATSELLAGARARNHLRPRCHILKAENIWKYPKAEDG